MHTWKKAVLENGANAFPGSGPLTPRDEEIRNLKAEVKRLEAERDILKKGHGVLRHPDELTFAWIEERKGQWPVAQMCRVRRARTTTPGAGESRVPPRSGARSRPRR